MAKALRSDIARAIAAGRPRDGDAAPIGWHLVHAEPNVAVVRDASRHRWPTFIVDLPLPADIEVRIHPAVKVPGEGWQRHV